MRSTSVFLAWFLSWKIYSECTTLQGIIIVYFTMKNTKNLERKSSADRITCFLPLYYNPLPLSSKDVIDIGESERYMVSPELQTEDFKAMFHIHKQSTQSHVHFTYKYHELLLYHSLWVVYSLPMAMPMVPRVLWYRGIYFVCSYALQRHLPVFLFIYS